MLGKVVFSNRFNNADSYTFNISGMQSGTYFCRIATGDKVIMKKIIKE
jgi:hypothetical protein